MITNIFFWRRALRFTGVISTNYRYLKRNDVISNYVITVTFFRLPVFSNSTHYLFIVQSTDLFADGVDELNLAGGEADDEHRSVQLTRDRVKVVTRR